MTVPPHFWREILVKSRQESTKERASFRPIIEFFVAVTHRSAGYRKVELVEVVTRHTMVRFDRNTTAVCGVGRLIFPKPLQLLVDWAFSLISSDLSLFVVDSVEYSGFRPLVRDSTAINGSQRLRPPLAPYTISSLMVGGFDLVPTRSDNGRCTPMYAGVRSGSGHITQHLTRLNLWVSAPGVWNGRGQQAQTEQPYRAAPRSSPRQPNGERERGGSHSEGRMKTRIKLEDTTLGALCPNVWGRCFRRRCGNCMGQFLRKTLAVAGPEMPVAVGIVWKPSVGPECGWEAVKRPAGHELVELNASVEEVDIARDFVCECVSEHAGGAGARRLTRFYHVTYDDELSVFARKRSRNA
ncbi:hypothetical protein DFH06DRAFT_1147002 [Mycena polygramma]|nr:hypothetical protein DFH06DRAFT_1147002 [Mycena polygramma]